MRLYQDIRKIKMKRYKVILSYDGSKFYGFEKQKNVRTVQKEIEDALTELLDETILIKGAGRTDKGVHALNQVIHFDTDKKVWLLKYKLNRVLKDIHINKIKKVNNDFHARFSVDRKIYFYKIKLNSKERSPYYYSLKKYDLDKMYEASKLFVGNHDYRNFVGGNPKMSTSLIDSITFKRKKDYLYIEFIGTHFYQYMVRNIVNAIIYVGQDKISLDDVKRMLAEPNHKKMLTPASPNGLYLKKITYK